MEIFWQDIRYGLRMLGKKPGFTSVVVLTMAIGIGASATIFAWIKAVLLEPLPGVNHADCLVEIWGATPKNSDLSLSYPDYLEFRDRNHVFSGLFAHQVMPFSIGKGEKPERVWGEIVSGNYFEVLGVKAALGRTFLPEEDRTPNTHPVVVLGHALWQRRFGSDPAVIGRTVALDGHDFTVIGVTSRSFGSTFAGVNLDVWTPIMMKDEVARSHLSLADRGSRWLMVMGRLKPGVRLPQARANIAAIAHQLEEAYPKTNDQMTMAAWPLAQSPYGMKGILGPALSILMAAVVAVLLIACANVANLLLAHAAARRKEIAVRLALGAVRQRVVRQMMTESLILSVLGAAGGLGLSFWTARSLTAFLPPSGLAFSFDTRPDVLVAGFSVVLMVFTTVLFGLAPALASSKPDLVQALKDSTTVLGRGHGGSSLRYLLVVAQVVLSMVALVGAGLFVRSLREANKADLGFDPDHVVLASFDPSLSGYNERRGREFYRRLLERVEPLPGMRSVSLARRLPLSLTGIAYTNVTIDGYTPGRDEDMRLNYETVGPKYFQTMRIPLARGRDFEERDNEQAPGVVIINETMARRYWPDGNAIAGLLKLNEDWLKIVGIARDVKYRTLSEAPQPFLYLPLLQDYRSNMILVARTTQDPGPIFREVQTEVNALDADMPIFDVQTLKEHVGISFFSQRMAATLLSIFGLLALSLAAIGLYGVMAYVVSQRTRELGIRMSVGAQRFDVFKIILRQGLILSMAGVVGGVVAALAVTRLVAHLLYGVSSTDPVTFALAASLLLGVALAASYFPARRATTIDPLVALRYD